MLLGWNNTFGPLLEGLADALKINVWRVHVDPASKLRDLDHLVVGALQASIEASDLAMGYWFHQSARLQGWIGDEVWKLSRDTYGFGQWLVHTYVPTYVHGLTDVLHGATNTLTKTVTKVEHVTVHVTRIVKVAAHDAAAPTLRVAKAATVGAFAPALAIPKLWRGIDDAETDIRKLMKRVTRTEALFGATAMAAAIANVLGIKSANCLRKGPIGRMARVLCGIPTSLLNDLLGLLADFFILENICVMLPWLESAASEIGTPLVELLTDVGAGLCAGAQAPAPLRGPAASVPALIFGVSASGV